MGSVSAELQETILDKFSQLKNVSGNLEFLCQAKNIFGEKARKIFNIIYSSEENSGSSLNPYWKEDTAAMLDQVKSKMPQFSN